MNFAALPPEVNSGLMYAGPGSGPILAAAAAWNGLAAELHSTAAGYESVVTSLTSQSWLGPSSLAMAAAAAPWTAWLTATATQAEQTAAQSMAAAAAYDAAFAMTVPPPVIAANRAQLMVLVATNIFGQNTAAIAATEALYLEMWVQDATAMYGYAVSAAAALELSPFTAPPRSTNPAPTAATSAPAALSQLAAAAPQALASVAAPAAAEPILPPLLTALISLESATGPPLAASSLAVGSAAWNSAAGNSRTLIDNSEQMLDNSEMLLREQDELSVMQQEMRQLLGGGPSTAGLSTGGAPVAASMARAVPVGGLSVPSNWAVAAPEFRAAAYALPAAGVAAAPAAWAGASGLPIGQMALAGMAGSAASSTVKGRRSGSGIPATNTTRVSQPIVSSPVTDMANGLRELAALRDAGILTEEEFAEQKRRLLDP